MDRLESLRLRIDPIPRANTDTVESRSGFVHPYIESTIHSSLISLI